MNDAGMTFLMNEVLAGRAGSMPLEATFSGIASSVPTARHLAATALAGCPRADDLLLALAGNAVAHSASGESGTFTVRVRTAPRWARIEVTDAGLPLLPHEPGNGWGLQLVAAVTDRSGSTTHPDGHRTGWAESTWPATHPSPSTGANIA